MLKKIWNWLVMSSANPNEMALTVKGFLGTLASILLLVSPIVHLHINDAQTTAITDMIIQIVLALCAVISALSGIMGFVRKIYLTAKGSNIQGQ